MMMIVDLACDQSIIPNKAFHVLTRTGQKHSVDGALQGRMKSPSVLEVVNGATLLKLHQIFV